MPKPTQTSLRRSLTAVTLGVQQAVERRDRENEPIRLADRDQIFQVDVTGTVESDLSEWTEIPLDFTYAFMGDENVRDNPYSRPQFTFGWEMLTAEPVILAACVTRWDETPEGEVVGALVKCAAHSPARSDAGKPFRAVLHLTFTGYCGPIAVDEDEEPEG